MGKLNEETVLEQIRLLGGNIAAVARTCGVDRTSIARFIERRPALRKAVRDEVADEARITLARQVADGNAWAVRLALQSARREAIDADDDDDGPELSEAERRELLEKLYESNEAKEQADSEGAAGAR